MKSTNATVGVLVGCVMLLGVKGVSAQDWPQWRGPNRDAKAAGFQAPKTWPKQLTKKWTVSVGGGDATPALVGDKLYVFTRQGEDEVLRCLDATSGKELWQDKYPTQPATGPAGGPHAGPRASPTVAEGKVVTLGVRGTLSCYDAASGKLLWRKDDLKGYWPMFFTSSSPLVVDGLCIAQVGGKENGRGKDDGAIVAYDLASGGQKWKRTGGSPGYASPVLLTVGGTKLIVAETDREIVAITAADGKLAWKAPFAPPPRGYNASTPIVEGQTIIYGGTGRGETAVKMDKQGDSFTAKELWSNKDNSVHFNTPVLKNGLLFGLSQSNQLFCVNAQNGRTVWAAPLGAPAGGGRGGRGAGFGSVVDAGSVLLVLTPASELLVVQPSDKQYTELARFKVAATPTYTYPVVSANRIFIKDQDSVTLWTLD